MKRLCSAILSAALLLSLCACNPAETVESDSLVDSGQSSYTPESGDPSENNSMGPTSSPSAQYNWSAADIPGLIDGLEMPVSGATGYTSVRLSLWSSIPGRTTDPGPARPTPSEPAPSTSQPPATASMEPSSPVETGEPVPTESEGPTPSETTEPSSPVETGEPGPTQSEEPTPVESEEPAPVESTGPDPELPTETGEPSDAEPLPSQERTPEDVSAQTPLFPAALTFLTAPVPVAASTPTPRSVSTSGPYVVATWEPGTAFVILEEDGDWWYVSRGDESGWIEHRYCMINLPDVIPSIIYNDTNAYSSIFVSCGKEIPGVTGEAFYRSLVYNVRLGRQEFVMPILYSAARNICAAQHKALEEGNCLVVYQTFRPYDTQTAVARALSSLANADPEVKAGISTAPWSMDWFIATGISNHQRGYAIDASLVKVYGVETGYVGSYPYLHMVDYAEYEMPTAMHELSIAAISTVAPGSNQLSDTMNEPAIALREYFTSSGLSPLASEWWHFNDNSAMQATSANPSDGRYDITECLSRQPELVRRNFL